MALLDTFHDGVAWNGAWRERLQRMLREPLLHFLLLGAAIFAIGDYRAQGDAQTTIVVDRPRVEHIASLYRQQFGAPPSPTMLKSLVDRDVEEEIYYREGLANGLDQDDQVIRRRVVQKMQFLEQDLYTAREPGERDLLRYYQAHLVHYRLPARVSFSHIYFSPDRGGDAAARTRALAVLATLQATTPRAPERGDPYSDRYDFAALDRDAATRLFGQTPITLEVFAAPQGRWSGPYRSGYGWHLVYVNAISPAQQAPFTQVRADVRNDAVADAQAAANRAATAALRSRYRVIDKSGVR